MKINFDMLFRAAMLTFLCGLMLFANSSVKAQCSLSMTVSSTPVTQLAPSDIDFEHFEGRNLLFTVTITNTNEVDVKAKLKGKVDILLADGTNYSGAATFETEEFPVRPGNTIITNLNLGRNANIKTNQFDYSADAKQKLQDISLATGKFPAGRYIFSLELFDVACNPTVASGSGQVTFTLQNNSRVELRSPSEGDQTGTFPFFEFFHEGEHAVLTVAEMNENQSREDAIERKPAMLEVELTGQNSFLYTSGRPLEQGKTYVWRIVSKSTGIGGSSVGLASEIRSFTVSSSTQQGGGIEGATLDQLKSMFGTRFKTLFDEITNGGYSLTGPYMLNGVTVDLNELMKQLGEVEPDKVDVTLE